MKEQERFPGVLVLSLLLVLSSGNFHLSWSQDVQRLPSGTSPGVVKPFQPSPQGVSVPPGGSRIPQGSRPQAGNGSQIVSPIQMNQQDLCRQIKGENCPISAPAGPSIPPSGMKTSPSSGIPSGRDKSEIQPDRQPVSSAGMGSGESEPYFPLRKEELTEGKVVEGVYYIVTPEKTTMVQMSSVDVNRIVCPVSIQDVVYSEEKGVKIKVVGRNAFVKFQARKVDDKIEYSTTPVDIHVVCNDKVFSLVAFPRKIPASLIFLEDRELTLKKKLSEISGMSFEEKIAGIVRNIFSGKVPLSSEYRVINRKYELFKDLSVEEKAQYPLEGEGLLVRFFIISHTGNSTHIDLNERMFLRENLTARPVAISLGKLRLNRGESTELVIIERKPQDISEK